MQIFLPRMKDVARMHNIGSFSTEMFTFFLIGGGFERYKFKIPVRFPQKRLPFLNGR
jgi:hypothetical protein